VSDELRAAVVQDDTTGRVLMLGWMDDEALEMTRSTGLVHFYSRSRQRLWMKGETSGNRLRVVGLTFDCDDDALLVRAIPEGPTCHTGSTSCFAPWLWHVVLDRDAERPQGSYVASLLERGTPGVARKVGEEAVELAVAALSESDECVIREAADLWFHTLVLLRARGLDPAAVDDELRRRHAARGGDSPDRA
jgi:phosphoribosyl-ATP pyrophosphohydrolase/phosphoribosyl-AMP cyclohydrolase